MSRLMSSVPTETSTCAGACGGFTEALWPNAVADIQATIAATQRLLPAAIMRLSSEARTRAMAMRMSVMIPARLSQPGVDANEP